MLFNCVDIEYIKENHRFETLTDEHDLSNFKCVSDDLDDFLKSDALTQQKSKLNLTNSVVTADAMSCQIDFVNTVIGKGAHYCLSLKGNQNKSFDEVRYLFNTTSQKQIVSYEESL